MTTRVWAWPNLWKGCVGAWSPSRQRWPCSTLIDYSPNNNHGTLTSGPIWTPSQGAYALRFDGTNYVNLGSGASIQMDGAVTVSARVRGTSINAVQQIVCNFDGTSNYNFLAEIGRTANRTSITWASTVVATGSIVINDLIWYHLAWVRSGAAGAWTGKTYVNGAPDASATTAVNPAGASTPTLIGRLRLSDAAHSFTGLIDDVRIYNRALNPSEITLLSRRRGIAYEIAPRRSYMAAVAGGITGPLIGGKLSRQTSLIGGRLVQ